MRIETVFTFKVKNGAIIASDIYNADGHLIVQKGSELNESIRQKLTQYSVVEIPIQFEDGDDSTIDMSDEKIELSDYNKKIINSQEYKEYVKQYNFSLSSFKDKLNDIVNKNSSLKTEELLELPKKIMSGFGNSFSLFDMMHNMNSYDDSTYAHSLNVSLICSVFADWAKLSAEDKKALTLAGLIHDIGKMKIPDSIIKKPGKLTDIEFKIIKNHTVYGYNIVKDQIADPRIKASVLMHHEKCDGSGYPSGLTGSQIPMFAKMVTIADVYDAMTSNRVYRGALCPFAVIKLFEDEGFSKYDTKLILTFLENVGQTYINNDCVLSDGRRGRIVLINRSHLSRPTVLVGNSYVDLSQTSNITIEKLL